MSTFLASAGVALVLSGAAVILFTRQPPDASGSRVDVGADGAPGGVGLRARGTS